eukprot:CAMPEP_0113590692 /NCGR_PEP_ID=MMETSP0015_2-20120614/36823_1 /TAXON_ID=2838 /ORGANISM="Odontella" /LENGTH=195 /DNA_ID=CAMNT_0000496927 /DNA_START=178 /DNA_END=766 /DNA_ORIENTATION=+ /assembly_acc=CAM_ASM_000160
MVDSDRRAFGTPHTLTGSLVLSPNSCTDSHLQPSPVLYRPCLSYALISIPHFVAGYHTKRSRTEASDGGNVGIRSPSPAQQKIIADLQRLVDHQATEIERLKAEKNAVESAASELKSSHDKAVNENRILKKAVTIQQERQKQASSEIESARGFRAEAEDRIRKLEQMNLTLRYHLQAQQPAIGNDFMGSRPPDVY